MSKTFSVHTFGCKVNTYDTGLLSSRLIENGYVNAKAGAEVHIINTCAVTQEATKEALRTARRLKAKDPQSIVVVTGCAAQVDTEQFEDPSVDLVVANSHKMRLPNLLADRLEGKARVYKSNIFHKEDLEPGGGMEAGHTRAFLKIQDGCNSFCTYCVIPFARGRSRSVPIADLVCRIQELTAMGVKEVVLTGVHIGDYRDGQRQLPELIAEILAKTTVPRLRLTSLEPPELTEELFELYRDPRLCRHFHMSIQSANRKVLKDMKRQYQAEAVTDALQAIAERLPGSFVGMDVIAGFPGETDDEFLDTYQRLANLPWTRLHVFPYSARPGTFAARRKDPVEPAIIKKRAQRLRELSAERWQCEAEKQIGQIKQALALKNGQLLSRDFWSIQLEGDLPPSNEELNVRITGVAEGHLLAQLLA